MTFQVLGLDHVVFRVSDIDRALAFYRDVLGCALERSLPDFGLYQLRAGKSLIDLVPVESELGRMGGAAPGREAHNVDHVALRIEPFDPAALRAHLAAHGIEMGEVARRYGAEGQGPSIYIEDPDGNTVELKGPPED
jgi:catechol 2,3-dioxygenase-like lactoylglutathione lyase family enzyme